MPKSRNFDSRANRNWAQFKRERHNGQWRCHDFGWLWRCLMLRMRNLFPSRLNRTEQREKLSPRVENNALERFRCRFYNRNKNASLLNGIERFSGSKRDIMKKWIFLSLRNRQSAWAAFGKVWWALAVVMARAKEISRVDAFLRSTTMRSHRWRPSVSGSLPKGLFPAVVSSAHRQRCRITYEP